METKADLQKLTKAELVEMAQAKGLDTDGLSKVQVIDLLLVEEQPAQEDTTKLAFQLELAKREAKVNTGKSSTAGSQDGAFKQELARRAARYGGVRPNMSEVSIENAFKQELARRAAKS